MQLEVLSRAVERKQQDINTFTKDKSDSITRANDQFAHLPLPTLPNEILSQIFSRLYWADTIEDSETSTLKRLADDSGTAESWKCFIQSCIPTAVTTGGAFRMLHSSKDQLIRDHVGPQPNVLSISRLLAEGCENILRNPSTVIFTTILDSQELEMISHLPWHNLFVSTKTTSVTSPEEILHSFVQSLGAKLAELDLLTVYPLRDDMAEPFPSFGNIELSLGRQFASTIHKAQLRLNTLHTFLPLLENIVDLELTISSRIDSPIGVEALLKLLASIPDTLESFTLKDFEGYPGVTIVATHSNLIHSPVAPTIAANRILFPRLNRLNIASFPECIVRDILSTINCTVIRHLCLTFRSCICFDEVVPDYVSATMLHNLMPGLRHIELQSDSQARNTQFYTELSIKHEALGWLLPALNSIVLGNGNRMSYFKKRPPAMTALAKLVSSRLSSDANIIRSVRVRDIELLPEDINTLRLLVPEFVH
ncbi:hypothetical protein SCHPADRAFT_936413 [Schizopora paradoxa]|uniref:Uncharacterized protein n=1 Tax=Schizopora paradoxa TaxID=27342 RepID=A0A0H2S2Q5_9AGAM|nr:hypothetical protein SCHPADRAFT_936413 [Schizopora paradoxa]